MVEKGYGQFCPVAMASEILCTRWTMLVVRELVCGSKRFNELRRGVPRMSPALLSKRLKELEQAGIIHRVASTGEPKVLEYHLTRAGEDLLPLVQTIGFWGQKWVEAELTLQKLDPSLLMWDMRRRLDPTPMPPRRCVIQFLYQELAALRRRYWMIVAPGEEVDLCSVDPGFEVDLYVTTDVRTMTAVWMGLTNLADAVDKGKLVQAGDKALSDNMEKWLNLSVFASQKNSARRGCPLIDEHSGWHEGLKSARRTGRRNPDERSEIRDHGSGKTVVPALRFAPRGLRAMASQRPYVILRP